MTLAEMLCKPHPDIKGYSAKELPWWLHLDQLPKLPAAPREIFNLYSWLIFDREAAAQVPAAWRDTLVRAPFAKGTWVAGRDWACAIAEHVGGDAAREVIRHAVLHIGDHSGHVPSIRMIATLLQLDGPAALPLLAKYFTAKSLDTYSNGCTRPWFAAARERYGVSAAVWDLLWSRKLKVAQLQEFQRQGNAFTAGDLRALAQHPVLGAPLRSLVLAVQGADGGVQRLFVLPEEPALGDGESYVIAHPAQVAPGEQRKWRQQLKHPPFEQWRAGPAAFEVSGCSAEPLPLLQHLAECGWRCGPVEHDGTVRRHFKAFSNLRAALEHEPIPVRFGAGVWRRCQLIECRFERAGVVVAHRPAAAWAAVAKDLAPFGQTEKRPDVE